MLIERVKVEMKTSTDKSSEIEVLWNKCVQKTLVKIHILLRKFTGKVTGDAAFLKILSFTRIFEEF